MPTKRALIVVDMSKEQVANIEYKASETIENIHKLASCGSFDRCFDSRLWIDDPSQTTLRKLYSEVGSSNTTGAELIKPLKEDNLEHVTKLNYSGFFGTPLLERLKDHDIKDVYICGINTDYCVFATALDAFYYGFNVYVVHDACTSIGGSAGHEQGLKMIQKFLTEEVLVSASQCFNLK